MGKSVFADCTNQYSITKTLRFELKPIAETLDNMKKNLEFDEELNTFLKDQRIKEAYEQLKIVFDHIHEEFITESLESVQQDSIDFSGYYEEYKNAKDIKKLSSFEKILRGEFAKFYEKTNKQWKSKFDFKKDKEKLFVCSGKNVLKFIRENRDKYKDIVPNKKLVDYLDVFDGFTTYLEPFNKNRKNYYDTSKEASTAVATRIVHHNLPRFCDNIILFNRRKDEYLEIYNVLKEKNLELKNKDGIDYYPVSEEVFDDISYFNYCLSQEQIKKYNHKIKNANFLINLYNQNCSNNSEKLLLFKSLYKQIGCGLSKSQFSTITHEFLVDAEKEQSNNKNILSLEEVLSDVNNAFNKYFVLKENDKDNYTLFDFFNFFKNRDDFDGVYWNKVALNTISNKYFESFHYLTDSIVDFEKKLKNQDCIELSSLFNDLDKIEDWKDVLLKKNSINNDPVKNDIIYNSISLSKALLEMLLSDISYNVEKFLELSLEIKELTCYSDNNGKEKIKKWMDYLISINQIIKYFSVRESKIKGNMLNPELSLILDTLLEPDDADWFFLYDSIRNFLTKKPQDDVKKNKLRLNFEHYSLAKGWDSGKISANYSVILRDDLGKMYLSIIVKQPNKKGFNKIFDNKNNNPLFDNITDKKWQIMDLRFLSGLKMLRKCLVPNSNPKKFGDEGEDVFNIVEKKKNKLIDKIEGDDLIKVVDFYKQALKKYEKDGYLWDDYFKFKFKDTKEYENINEFYSDFEKQAYYLDFVEINDSYLFDLVKQGDIYLFEIKNQDSNDGKIEGHKNNLHTIYWCSVFKDFENRPKLNAEAKLFFRKSLEEEKLEKVVDKNNNEIIKNYRFSRDMFLFYVSLEFNFGMKEKKINELINKKLVIDRGTNCETHFLGIDRGEKNLVYFSLVDQGCKIIDQGSFNKINNNNYLDKLVKKEKDRTEARKNWQTIGTIKELKEGYISQVIHDISKKIISNSSFVVLEDLNTGFKRGRQKFERQIYQKFEYALAKKLNFLVFKDAHDGELGSVTNAYQLTPPINTFSDIDKKKQVGVMLYTRANYTSLTDPVTGWRKSIYLKRGSESLIKKQIEDSFSDIVFDGTDYRFDYVHYFDKAFGKKINVDNSELFSRKWSLYSGVKGVSLDRYRYVSKDRKEWISEKIDLNELLDGLFSKFDKSKSLLSQIKEGKQLSKLDSKHSPFESLRFVIELIQQIRNTGIIGVERDNDFILSPVRNEDGIHFDSRIQWDKDVSGEKTVLPTCGDANGAFNIARKGIIMKEHIYHDDGLDKKDKWGLLVSDSEWDAWLSGRDIWEKWINNLN